MTSRLRVLRVIGRLNVGGPAQHVVLLNEGLARRGYETHLVAGALRPDEGSMAYFAEARGVAPTYVPELVTDTSLGSRDIRAVRVLAAIIRRVRPDVVHTHTAKAGLVGRLAARLAGVPVVVHTYHGHVFHGYFPAWKNTLLRTLETGLGHVSHRLIAVSDAIRDDLVRYGVADAASIDVVRLGLDLSPFEAAASLRGELRQELSISSDTFVMAIVGRLAPIKNHAVFVQAVSAVVSRHPRTVAVVVGDGELRNATAQLVDSLGLGAHVRFLGWRRDLPRIYADADVLVVSSDNEGTPVTAIEAMAAACPVVATRVGGVPDIIADGETGRLVPAQDAEALAEALLWAKDHPDTLATWAAEARRSALARHGVDALVNTIDALYRNLLATHFSPVA